MRVLVVGGGGREHALALTLAADPAVDEVLAAPGNAGISEVATPVPIDATEVGALADFAERESIDLTVVGPEGPLVAGLADELGARGLAVFGPGRLGARLEGSKAWARALCQRHGIPVPASREFTDPAGAAAYLDEVGPPVVVKADGLAAGKGVVVTDSRAGAESAITELMEQGRVGGEAARRVVIEEGLAGPEVSLLLWTDGQDYRLMPAARDHKRIGEGDIGPNTGGMGAITAPSVVLDEETQARAVREIVEPTLAGIRADQLDFRGVLFIGLMLTEAGPKVLEYNVRFGDPEAQAILVRLRGDLAEIFEAVAHGRLGQMKVEWSDEASACVVLAAPGYPEQSELGSLITGLDEATATMPDVKLFHAGTTRRAADGAWLTAGGRVLGVTATGHTLDAALRNCYESIHHLNWEGMQYRRDIGKLSGR